MPWTFSHPAAVLPIHLIKPGASSLLALSLGSLAPDLYYYVGAYRQASAAHTWSGFAGYCLPVGLLCFLIVLYLWPALRWFSPVCARARLAHRGFGWRGKPFTDCLIILTSLLLGSATHVFWDGFTHARVWGSTLFPILTQTQFVGIPLYSILQHSSTLLGLLALGWFCWRAPKLYADVCPDNARAGAIEYLRYRWYLCLLILNTVIALTIWGSWFPLSWILSHKESALFYLVIIFTSVAALLTSFAAQLFYRRHAPSVATS